MTAITVTQLKEAKAFCLENFAERTSGLSFRNYGGLSEKATRFRKRPNKKAHCGTQQA